jgi:hypothetical protein
MDPPAPRELDAIEKYEMVGCLQQPEIPRIGEEIRLHDGDAAHYP